MNQVALIGRLTKDVEINGNASVATARFTLAINRGKDKNGKDLGADYPSITCFGKTAELASKYLSKGRQCAVMGRIQTGSYEKDGNKVYYTSVVADRLEFLGRSDTQSHQESQPNNTQEPEQIEGFARLDDNIPF